MTRFGKLNLLAMLLPPAAAAIDGVALFGAGAAQPIGWMALLAAVPMILFGPLAGLMIRNSNKHHAGRGAGVALLATLVPAVVTAAWYLLLAVSPDPIAPGKESLAGPQYLLLGVLAMSLVAAVGWFIARRP